MSILGDLVSRTPRVWFITGAATGLGRAVADAALNRGDQVVATARDAGRRLEDLTGRFPDACTFRDRCPHAFDVCHRLNPQRYPVGPDFARTGHDAACFLNDPGLAPPSRLLAPDPPPPRP